MADDDNFVRITFRMPKDLHEKLTDAAAKKKSMNAEIIERLEASFDVSELAAEERGLRDELMEMIHKQNEIISRQTDYLEALMKEKADK